MILDLLDIGRHGVCGFMEVSLMYIAYDAYIRGSDTPVNAIPLYSAFALFLSKLFGSVLSGLEHLVAFYSVLQICSAICLFLSWRYSTLPPLYFRLFFLIAVATISIIFGCSRSDMLVNVDSLVSLSLIASPLASVPNIIQDKSSIHIHIHFTLLLSLYAAINLCINWINNSVSGIVVYLIGVALVFVQIIVYIVYFDTYYYTPILTQDKLTIHTEDTKRRRSIDLVELGQHTDRRRSLELVELGQSHTPAHTPTYPRNKNEEGGESGGSTPEEDESAVQSQTNPLSYFQRVFFTPPPNANYETYVNSQEPYTTPSSIYLGGNTPRDPVPPSISPPPHDRTTPRRLKFDEV